MKKDSTIIRFISIIATLILCIGLVCNGFELISNHAFRFIVLAGILIHSLALTVSLRRNEF